MCKCIINNNTDNINALTTFISLKNTQNWLKVYHTGSHPSSTAHIISMQLFRGKMHSDWFHEVEILHGRWQVGEKVGYLYPCGLDKTICKWDIYVQLVTKGLGE
jgi:hypothetical protein